MDNVELYINGTLCDTGKNLGVRLRRQLITTAELNTKDAQASYSITLPLTPTNDKIFNYASVEETKGKFIKLYTAELIINSHRIFNGNFKISEISKDGYKGNLVVPVAKTVKDIFGETKMNENAPFEIEFGDFAKSIKKWNNEASKENTTYTNLWSGSIITGKSPCIFPYVLYGLLPKSKQFSASEYSAPNIWDSSVIVGIEDILPSINVLEMLKHIFASKGYSLTGTAFDDDALKNLYMSYKNAPSYQQEWNWGRLGSMGITGTWTNIKNNNGPILRNELETQYFENKGDHDQVAVNLFYAKNTSITSISGNVSTDEVESKTNDRIQNTEMTIPISGLYRVNLSATVTVISSPKNGGSSNQNLGIKFAYANSHKTHNLFDNNRYEIKLVKNKSFENPAYDAVVDGVFYNENLNQGFYRTGVDSKTGFPIFSTYPKYFPLPTNNSILFVDPVQNANFVCGFRFGKCDTNLSSQNPLDKSNFNCSLLAAKPGYSWDTAHDTPVYCAVNSPTGYMKYGILEDEDDDDDDYDDYDDDSEIVKTIGYEQTSIFKINIDSSPINSIEKKNDSEGSGQINVIMWFDKGDILNIIDVCDIGVFRDSGRKKNAYIKHEVSFDLSITPFQTNKDWIKIDSRGNGIETMKWNDKPDFSESTINLIKFLPADISTDKFIDNFCKAFNLKLSKSADKEFSLDVKKNKKTQQNNFVDIDAIASIKDKTNQSLGLPSAYSIGFTINEDEEGYKNPDDKNEPDNGGGSIKTGAIDGNPKEQKSEFSYNWFKKIYKKENGNTVPINLPIISKAEVWTTEINYAEAMQKRYTDLAQRFWYYDGLLNDKGLTFKLGRKSTYGNDSLSLAKVSNALPNDKNILSYKAENNTILDNYFSLLTDANSHYTIVECYLQPEQYEAIGNGAKARFNGDIYYVADIDGYDPLNKNMCTLKLIRVI